MLNVLKCDNIFFEILENSPSKSAYKLYFVQCGRCGTVIGAIDYYNIGSIVGKIETKVDKIEKSLAEVSSINNNININQNIRSLYNLIESKLPKSKKE